MITTLTSLLHLTLCPVVEPGASRQAGSPGREKWPPPKADDFLRAKRSPNDVTDIGV